MKKAILITLFEICSITLVAQTSKHTQPKQHSSSTRYVFIVVTVNTPEYDAEYTKLMGYDKNHYRNHYVDHVSEIVTITGYNEEKKYRLIDKFRQQIYNDFVAGYHTSYDQIETKRSVISAEPHAYNSYKDASIARSTLLEN